MVYLEFGKILNLLWQIQYAIWNFFIVVNGQIYEKSSSHLVPLIKRHLINGKQFEASVALLDLPHTCYIFLYIRKP